MVSSQPNGDLVGSYVRGISCRLPFLLSRLDEIPGVVPGRFPISRSSRPSDRPLTLGALSRAVDPALLTRTAPQGRRQRPQCSQLSSHTPASPRIRARAAAAPSSSSSSRLVVLVLVGRHEVGFDQRAVGERAVLPSRPGTAPGRSRPHFPPCAGAIFLSCGAALEIGGPPG